MKILVLLIAFTASLSTYARYCATVYQGQHFSKAEMTLFAGDRIRNLNHRHLNNYSYADWDNKISSASVASGCRLEMFQYQNYGLGWDPNNREGRTVVIRNGKGLTEKHIAKLRSFDNLASSLKCKCK